MPDNSDNKTAQYKGVKKMKYTLLSTIAIFTICTGIASADELGSGFGQAYTYEAPAGFGDAPHNNVVATNEPSADDLAEIAPAAGEEESMEGVETQSAIPAPEYPEMNMDEFMRGAPVQGIEN